MDIAYCKKNKITYDIATFSILNAETIDSLRYSIICCECNGNGFYRKESINGIRAVFGANHEDDCKYKSKESSPRYDAASIEEVNTIQTNQDVIDVNFLTYTNKQLESKPAITSTTSKPTSSGSTSTRHTKKPIEKRNVSRGLRSLLRMLMKTDTFAKSDIKIKMYGKYEYYAKNLFVNFDDISESHINKKVHGYWGMLTKSDDELNWLNTRSDQRIGIPIGKINNYLQKTFKIKNADNMQGAMVLVFGELQISKNDKWFISIKGNSPSYIFINLSI